MTDIKINDFNHEVDFIYKGNKYSVRDNGAVLRHPQAGKCLRPLDNKWTFGKPCIQRGYMYFASKFPIHRIVASAFHGEPPTKDHVVDHIDTNRRNNRPENLRWLTRLENILLNPITVERIIFSCGSIEAFLEDPSILGSNSLDPNFSWMRTVTPEEAEACKARMLSWVQSDKRNSDGSLGEWVFSLPRNLPSEEVSKSPSLVMPKKIHINKIKPMPTVENFGYMFNYDKKTIRSHKDHDHDLVLAETLGAAQRKWSTPTEFPCCPQESVSEPINAYAEKLVPGVVFSRNRFSTSLTLECAIADSNQSILVMCQKAESGAIKPWTIAKITYEDGLYIHESIGSFFLDEGAKKNFCLAQGLEWEGGDTFDDFC